MTDEGKAEDLANLKKTRAALQGHLTRNSKRYETQNVRMDFVALQSMLKTLEELESKFLVVEEQIVVLDDTATGNEEEIAPSAAYEKFMDCYDELRDQIKTLIEIRRPKNTVDDENSNQSKALRLPKLNVPQFSGDVTQWTDFKNEFLSLVSDTELTDVDRFRFLRSALGEVPKRIISCMEITAENYKKAWDALIERFDNKSMIFRTHINEFLHLQGASGPKGHRELLDKARSHHRALTSLGTLENLAENLMICVLLAKIDTRARAKWEDYTDSSIATWDEFATFLERHTSTMENVMQTQQQIETVKPSQNFSEGSGKVHKILFTESKTERCQRCQVEGHSLANCPDFLSLNAHDRCDEVRRLKLCMKCLTGGHTYRFCRARCAKCQKPHHVLLHFDTLSLLTDPQPGPSSEHVLLADDNECENAIIGSVIIDILDDVNNHFPVHALLDSGSTTHVVSESVARLANVRIRKVESLVGGIGAQCTKITGNCSLRIRSRTSGQTFDIHASTMSRISGPYPAHPFDISSWKMPSRVPLANPKFNLPQKVDLLIGAGLFWNILQSGRIHLGPDLPYLQQTDFGWIVVGPMTSPEKSKVALEVVKNNDDDLERIVQRFWELDALPSDLEKFASQNDQICERLFSETTYRDDSGRYVVELPFKSDSPALGRSDHIAKQRFMNLERKLSRDPILRQSYVDFIEEYERLGHLEYVPDFDYNQPHYFIPHHCVLKPTSSTTKLRVVFDASCKTSNGISLNDILLSGPKVQEDLFVIFLLFRTFKYVATGDIQKMYRQTLVAPKHRNFQLIYWRSSPTEPLKVMRLKTVTYGLAPGAFLATRALKQLAIDESLSFPNGSKLISRNFYVDDALFGADTVDELSENLNQLEDILKKGGMTLGKICSNSHVILEGIPVERREKILRVNNHAIVRTLGMLYEPLNDDVLRFCCELIGVVARTKREILSSMARIFDPIGVINPVVCLAKIFYQDLWKMKLDWDDPLPTQLQQKWDDFCEQLSYLNKLSISRYIFCGPKPESMEIHGFSDASERAYGACVYVRTRNSDNEYFVELVCARSKVAPTKIISIARLELCAAKMLVELVVLLKEKIFNEMTVDSTNFWTDSMITLSWIRAEPHRWNTFVAHRVTKIQEVSVSSDWHHVPGAENPADMLSRGANPSDLADSDLWWHGPLFLRDSSRQWPADTISDTPLSEIDEARANRTVLLVEKRDDLTRSMSFSVGFRGTRRAFAYALRFVRNAREKRVSREERRAFLDDLDFSRVPIPSLEDEMRSEEIFIKAIQGATFHDEVRQLRMNRNVSGSSRLAQLSPYLHDGLLRVGGRIAHSSLSYDAKHQIILPNDHPYTNDIAFYFHHFRTFHAGTQTTLTAIRSRYWPLQGTSLVRKIAYNCLFCFRMRPRFMSQIMGDLPKDRVNPMELRAFNVTGVDFAGPFIVRHHIRCKTEKKVYLALFICMATKAVHVDLVPDLSTEAFLRALSRFIADRGNVAKMYSDNGTNFVGSANRLKEIEAMLTNSKNAIDEACRNWHIEWSFTPPRAPNFGGLWEASVKLLKRTMLGIAGDLNLTEDELRTVAKRAAAIINSRPITTVSSDPNDLAPLTPGHFIFGGPPSALPEAPVTITSTLNSVQVTRRMAAVNQQLWKRFSKEYLSLLQSKTKWLVKTGKFKVGSLVLLKEDNLATLYWPLGRILETFPAPDGTVRVVSVKTAKGIFKRSVSGMALLPDDLQPRMSPAGEDV